jgi:PIN domain nuclease of toxin-antitoxin system
LPGVLLDTHTLFWLVSGEVPLTEDALVAVADAQEARALLVSPITAWELAVATMKPRAVERPHLGDELPDRWFRDAVAVTEARIVPMGQRVALEAARVAQMTGHKDPGDCFLVATARIGKVPLVTRDRAIRAMAAHSDNLDVVGC